MDTEKRHFDNPFEDFVDAESTPINLDVEHLTTLIRTYVDSILENCPAGGDKEKRGDLYVGEAGIAYMFWKLSRSDQVQDMYPALQLAQDYIRQAKIGADHFKKYSSERFSFVVGNAGIYAIGAAIAHDLKQDKERTYCVTNFLTGIAACKEHVTTPTGCDEFLVGRAGYIAGCAWINEKLGEAVVSDADITSLCNLSLHSGREYAAKTDYGAALMYRYHGADYLGAAHGVIGILLVLLDNPAYRNTFPGHHSNDIRDIRRTIDYVLSLKDDEGNIPTSMEDVKTKSSKCVVQWCHGVPGFVFLLAKSYFLFKDEKYLTACRNAADLVWRKGLLYKGPGICHGVGGNGYVFLVVYQITKDPKYFYRAIKFMEFLTHQNFKKNARTPDHPFSLYEGLAGTVCFLIDLLQPKEATFPFMNILPMQHADSDEKKQP